MSKQDTQHHIVSKCPRAQLDGATTVPLHGSRDLKIGTVASIERQTGLKLK